MHAVEFTCRVHLHGRGASLRLAAAEPRLYGYLPVPAPLFAHRLLVALVAGGDGGGGGPAGAEVVGLGEIALAPLRALLWNTLPAAGWRLPDARGIGLVEAGARRGEVMVRFAPAVNPVPVSAEASAHLEALDRFRVADAHLQAGDLEAALRAYRGELAARGAQQPFLVERILSITAARPAWFRDAEELARQALGRWPDFAPAHIALAAVAVAEGDLRGAAERFRRLADSAAQAGDDEAGARAALAGARLLRQVAPAEATPLYERVLAYRPGHGESVEALAERYGEEGRFAELARLIRARLAATQDRHRQALDHLRLAALLREQLADPAHALEELEAATRLAPDSAPAWEALADLHVAMGDHAAAVRALEAVAGLAAGRGDGRAEARAHLRAGRSWELCGDDDRADASYRRALELDPDGEALEPAAAAAARRGRFEQAAGLWRRVADRPGAEPGDHLRQLSELGRCLLAAGDREGARAQLAQVARDGDGEQAAGAWELLARLAEGDGDGAGAAHALEAAAARLVGAAAGAAAAERAALLGRAAALRVDHAGLLLAAGDRAGALAAYRSAHALAPEREEVRPAARALYEAALADGDAARQREWIDALVALGPGGGEEEIALRLARAELAVAGDDRAGAADDVADLLAAELTPGQRARALALHAELLAAAGDAGGRARALASRALLLKSAGDEAALAAARLDAAEAALAVDDAAAALETARQVDGGRDPRAAQILGEAAWRARSWDDVVRAYDGLDGAPAGERVLRAYRLGVAHDKAGRPAEAIAALRAAVNEGAGSDLAAISWRLLAGLYERVGDSERAAGALEAFAGGAGGAEAAGAPAPVRADAWYRAGELHRKLGDGDGEERCLQAALRLVPDHIPALDALERIERERGDDERVAVILGRKIAATARQPARQKPLLARLAALQHERLGRSDVARETYKRALDIDPGFRPALRFVAEEARARGDLEAAADAYRRLAEAAAGDGEADAAGERREAVLALAELLAGAGRGDEAAPALQAALAASPDDHALLAALADSHRAGARWPELAEVLGRRAAAAASADAQAALRCDQERIEILLERVNDAGAALVACRGALARSPGEPTLLAAAVECARQAGGVDDLVSALVAAAGDDDAAVLCRQSAADLFAEAARAAAAAGDGERARPLWRRAVDADAGHAEARAALQALGEALPAPTAGQEPAPAALAAAFAPPPGGDSGEDALEAEIRRAAEAGNRLAEARATRRLAAAVLDRRGDGHAGELFTRALALDPDDLASAEALVALHRRRRDGERQQAALEQLLEVARRTGAGAERQAAALGELARLARGAGDLARAAQLLDEACALDRDDAALLRARAELASAQGDPAACAAWLERAIAASQPPPAEVLLELAELYGERLGDRARARDAMRRAAAAFGAGARGDATFRLAAAQAMSAQAYAEAVAAFEAVPPERRLTGDLIELAKAHQRLGRDRVAVELLESANRQSALGDEAAMLLFALHRELKRKRDLAAALERGAAQAPPEVARTRMREALRLYEQALGDPEAALRLRAALALAPAGDPGEELPPRPPSSSRRPRRR